MIRVYVAGPLTKGDQFANVALAMDVGNSLLNLGFAPFVPHLYAFMHMVEAQTYETWMKVDDAFLRTCDALLRLPGESAGSDIEVERAMVLSIPVFYTEFDLVAWARAEPRADVGGVF